MREYLISSIWPLIVRKKSCCLRIGQRHNNPCAPLCTLSGDLISWVDELRYLGVIIMRSRAFKCSLHHAKKLFYRSANAIFGEIGRIASEDLYSGYFIWFRSLPINKIWFIVHGLCDWSIFLWNYLKQVILIMSNIVKNVSHLIRQAICGENEWLTSRVSLQPLLENVDKFLLLFCLLVLLYIMLAVFHATATMIWMIW